MKTNFYGIKPDIVKEIGCILHEVFEKYPEVEQRLEYVGIPEDGRNYYPAPNAICHVSGYGTEMVITTKINDVNEKRDKISGYTIPGIKAKILHECGHLIDKCIQQSCYNCAARTENSKNYRKVTTFLYNKYRAEQSSVVSRYAKENQEEFVAEVYAQMVSVGKDANEYTQKFATALGKIESCDFGERFSF